MTRRLVTFVGLAVTLGLLFVRLGFWQLDRLAQRRAENLEVAGQLAMAPVPITRLLRERHPDNRRAIVNGAPDYGNEFVLTGRSRSGSPGVHLITPLKVPGEDTAILVNRGWVYAADARTADLGRWREARTSFSGHTQVLDTSAGAGTVTAQGRAVRRLTTEAVASLLPYPVHRVYVIAQDSEVSGAPARLPAPALDEGPHFSYALQWFAFATIAIVGAVAVVTRTRQPGRDGSTGA
jgi:surfeit locus 1 family protein